MNFGAIVAAARAAETILNIIVQAVDAMGGKPELKAKAEKARDAAKDVAEHTN